MTTQRQDYEYIEMVKKPFYPTLAELEQTPEYAKADSESKKQMKAILSEWLEINKQLPAIY